MGGGGGVIPATSAQGKGASAAAARRRRQGGADEFTLSVVVPAWNEAERIPECIRRIVGSLCALDPEVIVVDDGSTDGTAEVCRAWIASHPSPDVRVLVAPHRGKGAAVRAGALASRGDVVAFIDADLDVAPEEIARLLRVRQERGLDVVVGSKRDLSWRRMQRPLPRRLLSLSFSAVARLLFRLPVRDTQTGIKLFDGPWLRSVAPHARVQGFLFDVELLALAAAAGLRMGEVCVPVGMSRPASRIGVRDVLRCMGELALIGGSLRHARHSLAVEEGAGRRQAPAQGAWHDGSAAPSPLRARP